MAFSLNYRSWRTVAMATLMHENSEYAAANHSASAKPSSEAKLPVKSVKTIGYWIKNMGHAA